MSIIPQDLFFWLASPVDFNNLWKKFDHKSMLEELIRWDLQRYKDRYYLYRNSTHYHFKDGKFSHKSYFNFLWGIYKTKCIAEFEMQYLNRLYLEDPQRLYVYCGIIS